MFDATRELTMDRLFFASPAMFSRRKFDSGKMMTTCQSSLTFVVSWHGCSFTVMTSERRRGHRSILKQLDNKTRPVQHQIIGISIVERGFVTAHMLGKKVKEYQNIL